MTHTMVPLDSYRLAQYAVPVPCFVCGNGNAFDRERCSYCQTPMALTYQASTLKSEPQVLSVLSSPKAGKTAYLGVLTDMLSRQNGGIQLLARGAFSVSMQQTAVSSLARGWFPPRTPDDPSYWNWMHCRIMKGRRRALEMILPDVPGEIIAKEIDHPQSQPLVKSLVGRSKAAMVLLDASRLVEGDRQPDFFALKAVSYLCELQSTKKFAWSRRPIALTFTKADQAEAAFDNPVEFAQRYAPGLWHHCRQQLRRYQFFATSIAGGHAYLRDVTGRRPIPLRIEPRNVVEPFDWLLRHIS